MRRTHIFLLVLILLGWPSLGLPLSAIAQSEPGPTAGPRRREREGERQRFPGVMGSITALSENSMTVKTFHGKTATVKLTDKTQYRKDRQPARLDDFKVGDAVMVRGEPTGEDAWAASFIATRSNAAGQFREGLGKQFIVGDVKAIEGTGLTILRTDGETQTIQVDESTSFRKQGESITLADIKAGDHVFGRGELKNGIFVPTLLNVGEFRRGPMSRGEERRE